VTKRAALLLVFCTSGAVLVLEILAGRLMAPYVGVSIETFTGIIGTILAGIALGSAVGGKLADRHPPERLIGPTLVIGGLASWASLPVVSTVGPGSSSESGAIVALAFLAFFAPAAALSAVSPMVAKLMVRDLAATGTVVGGLSAAGTLGALVGTFLTGFVLVTRFATRPMVLAVGLAMVLLGVLLTLRLGGQTRPSLTLLASGLVLFGWAAASDDRCEFESAYVCGSVEIDAETSSVRTLVLDSAHHATVDLDDPTYLGFRYTRLFGELLSGLEPGPIDALHIGGGGFSFPRYIAAVRPGSTNLVLEIDPVLVDIGRRELGLVTDERLRVETGDARLALPHLDTRSYDLIIGDAFNGTSVPWHLTTSEFVAELARVLRPDGVYAMNVIDGGPNRFARAAAATLQLHFDHVAVIAPPGGVLSTPRNQLMLASNEPLPAFPIDPDDGQLVTSIDAFIDDQHPLTDDFAPADQLARR
jgi:spermidine synthase